VSRGSYYTGNATGFESLAVQRHAVLALAIAPQLVQALIATTTVAIEFIAHRVFFIVALMIVLSKVEL
jgi:hypothetical protein